MVDTAEDDRENPESGIENTLAERLGECRERAHEALEEKDSAGKTPAERKADEIFDRMAEEGTTPDEERAALDKEIKRCDAEAPCLANKLTDVENRIEGIYDKMRAATNDGERDAFHAAGQEWIGRREELAGRLDDVVFTAELDKDVKCRMGWTDDAESAPPVEDGEAAPSDTDSAGVESGMEHMRERGRGFDSPDAENDVTKAEGTTEYVWERVESPRGPTDDSDKETSDFVQHLLRQHRSAGR